MSTVKIKIRHGNTEVEIEGPEDFLIKFLNSKDLFKSEPSKQPLKKKPIKKVTKKSSIDKSKPGENYGAVIGVLKLSKDDGTTIKEICEATKLSKIQVGYEIRKAMKSGEVKQTEKGVYEIVKENKGSE